jgi:uncharacterized protein YueI
MEAYKQFLNAFFAMLKLDYSSKNTYLEQLAMRVILALTDEQVALFNGRLPCPIFFDQDAPSEDAPEDSDIKISPASSDATNHISINIEHPGYVLNIICTETRNHFSIRENEESDIDDDLLEAFVREAYELHVQNVSTYTASMDLEKIISILPSLYVMPNTQLSKELTSGRAQSGELNMTIAKRHYKPVVTKAILTFGSDKAVISTGKQNYSPYDSAVYSGIITLFEAENTIISPAMVYRAMNGLNESEYVNPSTLEKVEKSIDKNRTSQLTIDFTEEARQYMRPYKETADDFHTTYQGNLLVADKITVKNNGMEQTAYKILRKPILYEYAQMVNQVITIPIQLLHTKGGVHSTEEVIVLREYLLRQIENYKRRKKAGSFSLSYFDIYDIYGISAETHKNLKDKYKKIRHHTEAILGEWKRLGYILDYESKRGGTRAISEVEIYT